MTAIPAHVREKCAGLLLIKEWKYLGQALADPARPYVAISGGAKVSTKLGILRNLLSKVDKLIVGGAMANTFFLAQGHGVGTSLAEPDLVGEARAVLDEAARVGGALAARGLRAGLRARRPGRRGHRGCGRRARGQMILDAGRPPWRAGPRPWPGGHGGLERPVGLFENPAFAAGSTGLARAVVDCGALTIIGGGGDTGAALAPPGWPTR
jgi:phosphoglycerate kinase